MKKVIKTLMVSLLVVVTFMTTTVATVSAGDTSSEATQSTTSFGTHILTAPEVEDERYILKDGEFLYTLVTPENPTVREKVAKEEFILLLKRATGIVATAITDADINEYNPDTKYISIGQTKLLDLAGIQINRSALKSNGVRIITKDNNIFLAGGVSDGALNAVYDFFQICFDFEWYARNNLYINDTITTLKLRNFDVTDIPDINTQQITYGPMSKSSDTLTSWDSLALASDNLTNDDLNKDINNKNNRSRYSKPGRGVLFTAHGRKVLGKSESTYGSQHNVLNIFNKYEDNKDNGKLVQNPVWEEKWWADSQTQLCWTAHGDEASYQRMVDYAVERVISYMKKYPPASYPEMSNMMFGVEDGGVACRCDECEYRLEQDGSRSGASIRFVRLVYDKLRDWLDDPANAEWYREDFKIVIFAYSEVKEPPTHKDAEGNWVVNEGIYEGMEEYRGRMFDDIIVWKTFNGPQHLDVYSGDPQVSEYVEEFKAWSVASDGLFAWNYAELYLDKTFFQDYLSRWNTNMVEFYHSLGIDHVLTELCSTGDAVTRWGDLYYYMITKLGWNGSQSSTELISKFMKAHYGPAADTMEALYYAQKSNFQRAANDYYNEKGYHFDLGFKAWTTEHYPYSVIKSFIDYIDQAYADIEILKTTDPDMYEVIKDRIDVEGIAHYYVLMKLYKDAENIPYTPEEKELYKNRAIDLLEKRTMSGGLTVSLFNSWE